MFLLVDASCAIVTWLVESLYEALTSRIFCASEQLAEETKKVLYSGSTGRNRKLLVADLVAANSWDARLLSSFVIPVLTRDPM